MGLDKKPTPPQKRVKEELSTSKSPDAKEATDVEEDIETHSNAVADTPQEMETEPTGETTGKKKSKDDYEEDFEADDEGPVEYIDEVEEKPSSATSGGEKQTRDENDINEVKSNSDSDDASMSKVKRSSSVSSGQTSCLSSSDNENSEREIVEDTKEVTTANVPEESLHAEEDLTTAETKPEETEVTESSDITLPQTAAEDSGTQDSPGDGMEKSDLEMSEDTDNKEGTEGEQSGEDAKPEDKPQENEPERAKSMQEKLAEAILKESQCSSEPEFSDTSTEEDEGASEKTQHDIQGAEMESAVGFTSPQPSNTQDEISEKSEANTQESRCEETAREPHVHAEEEIGETQEAAASLDIEERQKDKQSERTNEVEQPDKREEVKNETEDMQEKDKDGDNTNAEPKEEEKDSLVQDPETHTEMLDAGNTDTEVPEMEEMDLVSHTENDTETGADDTQRQRDADDADQNIERRSDGQPDRDEREDLADGAGDDRSTGEMVQKTDGKVDSGGSVGKQEDGEKSSEEKEETKKLEVEDQSEDLGIEVEKPRDEEIQVGVKENELEGDQDSKAEDKQNKDSTEKDMDGVNDEHKESKDGEPSIEVINRLNESQESQNVRAEGNEKEDDGVNYEQKEQVENILCDGAKEEGHEIPNSEVEIGGEIKKGTDKMMENSSQEEEKEKDGTMDEMAEGIDGNYEENEAKDQEQENELETGEKLKEESEKEMPDINEISENTFEAGDGQEAVSDENTAQKLEDNFEDLNEEPVSQEEQNEMGSSGPKDDTEASTKDELGEPAEVNNDLLDNNIDAENGETQDVSLEEDKKVEEYLQEETQDKSEAETTGDSAQEVIDDNKKPETDKDVKEEENDNDKEQETKLNAQVVPSEKEPQLGSEHEDQDSDNQKVDKEDDKASETSATTFIENITQTRVNKETDSEIVSEQAEVTAEEPELKGTDNELRSRDAPEGMDSDPVQPLKGKGNLINEEGGSSVSYSVESQPVKKIKKGDRDPVLNIDSDDQDVHPVALAKVVGVDLVSNWINIHQESKYFQTFIEPLDEEGQISEETEERLNGEVLDATETPTSTDIGALETLKSGDETAASVRNNTESVVESLKTETKVEAIEADAVSNHSIDSIHTLNKDERVQEAGDTRGSLITSSSRQSNNEDTNQEDTAGQETLTSKDIEDRAPSETEQQNVPRKADLNAKESEQCNQQNITDETKHLSQTEEPSNKETLESLEDNLKSEHVPQSEDIEPQSPTITVITDLTIVNKSENGSQNDTASVDFHSRQSDESRNVNGNRRTKVIDGHFTQTLSTETLTTFSLDDSRFFGPAGYPRLTTAHTENSY